MTKEFCVKQKHFEWAIGYSLWGLLSFGLFFMTIAMLASMSTYDITSYNNHCFTGSLDGKRICTVQMGEWFVATYGLLICSIINIIVIILWVNAKKEWVNFSWCDEEE